MSTQYIKHLSVTAAVAFVLIGLTLVSAIPMLKFLETAGQARETAAVIQRDALAALIPGR